MRFKPIPTKWNNIYHRSRLEARYHVLFDGCGVVAQYEMQGYKLTDHSAYLPDYFSTVLGYLEVKAEEPTALELFRVQEIAEHTGRHAALAVGTPSVYNTNVYLFFPSGRQSICSLIQYLWPFVQIGDLPQREAVEALHQAIERAASARFERGEEPEVLTRRWRGGERDAA